MQTFITHLTGSDPGSVLIWDQNESFWTYNHWQKYYTFSIRQTQFTEWLCLRNLQLDNMYWKCGCLGYDTI